MPRMYISFACALRKGPQDNENEQAKTNKQTNNSKKRIPVILNY